MSFCKASLHHIPTEAGRVRETRRLEIRHFQNQYSIYIVFYIDKIRYAANLRFFIKFPIARQRTARLPISLRKKKALPLRKSLFLYKSNLE